MVRTGSPDFDLFYDGFDSLTAGGHISPAWSPDGKSLAFVDGSADDRRGWIVDLASGSRTELVDIAQVRQALCSATGETPAGRGLPFSQVAFVTPRMISAQVGRHLVTIDLDSAKVTRALEEPSDTVLHTPEVYWRTVPLADPQAATETVSPDGRLLASTRNSNIMLRWTTDGREMPLTTDGTPECEWRFDPDLPASEKLRPAAPATNWSPDGGRLAAYKVDNRGVARAVRVHYLKRDDEVVYRYHAKAGGVLERYTLHLLDVYGKAGIEVDLGDTTDSYPVFAGWLPDGSEILITQASRDCRRIDVLAADTTTGTVRRLFSEVGETFRRMQHDLVFTRKLGLWLTPDGRQLLWLSERDGWKHLYAYNLQGELLRQLTRGDWPVDTVERIDGRHVYFTAAPDQSRPYDLHLCRTPLDGGEVVRITEGEGTHQVTFSPGGEAFIDTWSTPAQPPVAVLRRADGGQLGPELSPADTTCLDEAGWTAPEQFTVTAADQQTKLWGVMFLPPDFDPGKCYPLIEYVYGGPQTTVCPHDWTSNGYAKPARALAQLGYVTVVLDSRGTPGRSKAFHDAVYMNWAGAMVEDHATALRQLADRHGFIDAKRVGVIGHSWGGASAFRLLVDRPDIYRAAVCSAPGFDANSSVLFECYLGMPQYNRTAYDAANQLTLAPRLQKPLMIAAGTSDHVTWSRAIKMSEALIRAGKDHQFVVLPEQGHNYSGAAESYYWRKVVEFFSTNLGTAAI